MLWLTVPDHPAVWMRASETSVCHRQRDPDLARGSRDEDPEHRAACGARLPASAIRSYVPSAPVCGRCAEISGYEASFPPT